MKLVFADAAWEDYLHWQANAPNVLQRVNELMSIYSERITSDFLAVAPAKERYDD